MKSILNKYELTYNHLKGTSASINNIINSEYYDIYDNNEIFIETPKCFGDFLKVLKDIILY